MTTDAESTQLSIYHRTHYPASNQPGSEFSKTTDLFL